MSIQDVKNMFVPNRIGRLMRIQESELTRFQFEIWFEYTRKAMVELKEGTLLAAKNFATSDLETHYSILETTSVMPIHYALGENVEGYPGFVMEAARNVATDWISQETESLEDTTIIRCIATPAGLEIAQDTKKSALCGEQSLPMIGSDVRVLTSETTQEIVNREISPEVDHIFVGGNWLVDNSIPIYVLVDDFIRVHSGIFGFTGAGKSNLLSAYVTKLLKAQQQPKKSVKVVLFDLMSEYSVLLLDQLVELPHAYVLAVDEYSLPSRAIEFLRGNSREEQNAASDLSNTALYPRPLLVLRDKFAPAFALLLRNRKVRLYKEPTRTLGNFLDEHQNLLMQGNIGKSKMTVLRFIDNLRTLKSRPISSDLTNTIVKAIGRLIGSELESPGVFETEVERLLQGPESGSLTATATSNLKQFQRVLEQELEKIQRTYPTNSTFSIDEIISDLNNSAHSSLFVVQSHDPDNLRDFAHRFGTEIFERRRTGGIISPLVCCIFDEADEFIPSKYEKGSSHARSAYIVEMLARRGRKFGIGISIGTQRTTYLKTSVMAQPHTYLVSRMPRTDDRQRVQEAFGFSDEMLRQTFKFGPGDWLLASHDATGLKGVPIPIHVEDSNERVRNFLVTLATKGE
jgi:DNA helicase HerA-like ATPase